MNINVFNMFKEENPYLGLETENIHLKIKNISYQVNIYSLEEIAYRDQINYVTKKNIKKSIFLDDIESNIEIKNKIENKIVDLFKDYGEPPESYDINDKKKLFIPQLLTLMSNENFNKGNINLVCSNSAHHLSKFLAERVLINKINNKKLVINFDQHVDFKYESHSMVNCGNWGSQLNKGIDYLVIGVKYIKQENTDEDVVQPSSPPFIDGYDYIKMRKNNESFQGITMDGIEDSKKYNVVIPNDYIGTYKDRLKKICEEYDEIYITVDLDVLDGIPGVRRTDWSNGLMSIDKLFEFFSIIPFQRVVGFDITGFPPLYKEVKVLAVPFNYKMIYEIALSNYKINILKILKVLIDYLLESIADESPIISRPDESIIRPLTNFSRPMGK